MDEGAPPTEVYLTISGAIAVERRRELDDDDDDGVRAAVAKGLFHDTVTLAVLPAPVLVGDVATLEGEQPCKVTALGDAPLCANDDDAALDVASSDYDPRTGEKKVRGVVRCLAVPADLFGKILASRPAERKALEACAAVGRAAREPNVGRVRTRSSPRLLGSGPDSKVAKIARVGSGLDRRQDCSGRVRTRSSPKCRRDNSGARPLRKGTALSRRSNARGSTSAARTGARYDDGKTRRRRTGRF